MVLLPQPTPPPPPLGIGLCGACVGDWIPSEVGATLSQGVMPNHSNTEGLQRPKASKTFLVVKGGYAEEAERALADTSVSITRHGKKHLGVTVGSVAFRDGFMSGKVKSWCITTELLSQVALSHPHAACAAYVHGQASKWSYISRTIPGIGHLPPPQQRLLECTREKGASPFGSPSSFDPSWICISYSIGWSELMSNVAMIGV